MGGRRKVADGKQQPNTLIEAPTAPLVRCRNVYGEIIYLSPDMARQAVTGGAVTLARQTEGTE